MAQLYGALGIADSDLIFTTVAGQMVIWDETQRIFNQYNEDLDASISFFVESTTEAFKERYYLPGGGESQDEDISMAGETAAVRPSGSWDVAYPMSQIGDSLAFDDIGIRFVSMQMYDATVQTIINRSNNATFRKILRAILKNTNTTFVDPIHGSLTVVPLANGDSVVYPPPIGTTTEATQQFYVGTAYAESAISNTNNPFATLKTKLEAIHGIPQGGSPIIALVNTSTVQYAYNLAGFEEVTNRYASPGDNITTLTGLPVLPQGMRVVGVDTLSSVVIVEWPRMPSAYIIGMHADGMKPLKRRRDPAATGLTPGLTLWSKTPAEAEPFSTARWRNRQGFGVGNRLGAVVIHLSGTGTYAIPTGYT